MTFLNAVQAFEFVFDLNGDGIFDIARCHASVGGGDKDMGDADVRLSLPGQGEVAVGPHDQNKGGKNQDGDAFFDGKIGDDHGANFPELLLIMNIDRGRILQGIGKSVKEGLRMWNKGRMEQENSFLQGVLRSVKGRGAVKRLSLNRFPSFYLQTLFVIAPAYQPDQRLR